MTSSVPNAGASLASPENSLVSLPQSPRAGSDNRSASVEHSPPSPKKQPVSGYLHKYSVDTGSFKLIRGWNRRFFKLVGTELKYSEDEQKPLSGSISLGQHSRLVTCPSKTTHKE